MTKDVKQVVGGKKTLVEEGTQFKGSLISNCPVEVKGAIQGDVTAPSLTVSASGAVRGTIKVGELRSEGELAGEFDADVVLLSGVVKDNTVIRAKSMEVKLAVQGGKMQVIFGECILDVGDAPVRETAAGTTATENEKPQTPPARVSVRPAAIDVAPVNEADVSWSAPPPARVDRKSMPPAEANGAD